MLTGSNKKRFAALPGLKKVLALAVIAAMIAMCFAGTVFAVDLDEANSLTVTIGDNFEEDDTLDISTLNVDMYLVATAEPAVGYDTYTLDATDDFEDLQEAIDKAQIKVEEEDVTKDNPDNKTQWEAIAQDAVELVKDGEGGTPVYKGRTVGEKVESIAAGLYLVLTHSTDEVIEKNYYDSYFFANDEAGPVSTIGLSDAYEYHFTPQLIALPYKDGADGTFNTEAAAGDWKNDLTVVLKGDMTERFGSIVVTKTLTGKDSHYRATFVFDVEATKTKAGSTEPVLVYSNVFSLNFDQDGAKSFTVEKIPVGAEVTVTEVYSGSSYILTTDRELTDTLKNSTEPLSFAFKNKAGDGPGGTGILNTFTNNGEDWIWNPDYNRDSSSATASAAEE